jgi:hypothetical protein
MKLYFIIATIEGREKLLNKLLNSIKIEFKSFNYKVVIIRQYSVKKKILIKKNSILFNIKSYGASRARNIGLKKIKKDVKDNDYICFPDDDCYYAKNFQKEFLKNLEKSIDLIFGDIRDPDDKLRMGTTVINKKNLKLNFPSINCPSFFIRYKLIKNLFFDENYGPGTLVPAVEETEFLYRISKKHNRVNCKYDSNLKIFHPYKILNGQKLKDYSFAQGVFLRKIFNPILIQFWAYLIIIVRPFVGLISNQLNTKNRKFYKVRSIGIIKGFLNGNT